MRRASPVASGLSTFPPIQRRADGPGWTVSAAPTRFRRPPAGAGTLKIPDLGNPRYCADVNPSRTLPPGYFTVRLLGLPAAAVVEDRPQGMTWYLPSRE